MGATPLPSRIRRPVTLQDAVDASADGTILALKNDHANIIGLALEGTVDGTLYFEVSLDPNSATPVWGGISGRRLSNNAISQSATTTGLFVIDVSGFLGFRARWARTGASVVTVKAWNLRGGGSAAFITYGAVTVGDISIVDPTTPTDKAAVLDADPAVDDMGLVVRPVRGEFEVVAAVSAAVDNAAATATQAAPSAGLRLYCSGISASFNGAIVGKLLQLIDDPGGGAAVLWRGYVHSQRDVTFNPPLRGSVAKSLSLVLAASGSGGTSGACSMQTYTAA